MCKIFKSVYLFKLFVLNIVIFLAIAETAIAGTVETGMYSNPCNDRLIDFENGIDKKEMKIQGIEDDLIIGDFRTGYYNGKFPPRGRYTSDGTKWAWFGPAQSQGLLKFTNGTASYFSLLTSTESGMTLEALDKNGNILDSATAVPNPRTGWMTRLTVSASSPRISYINIHDTGNFFLIDDICTDAPAEANVIPPYMRDVRIAVILAEPSDEMHDSNYSKNYYLTNIIPDLKDYYNEVSYGAVNIVINPEDVYDNNGNWYKLGKTAAYYGKNTTIGGNDNSSQFLFDSAEAADPDINFNSYDSILVVHANKSQQELGNDWDFMVTHAWVWDRTLNSGEIAKSLILISETELMGAWAHEIGHPLGKIFMPGKADFLPDRYGNNGDHSITDWDLMGSGNWLGNPAGSKPDHMSSFSKEWLGWLKYRNVGYGNQWVNSLATMKYGDSISRYIVDEKPEIQTRNYYIIETRTNNPAYSKWDTTAPIPEEYGNNALVLYKVDEIINTSWTVDFIDNRTPWNGIPYQDRSSYWDFANKIRFVALDERARIDGTRPLFEMKVGIENFSIPWLVGAVLSPRDSLMGYAPTYGQSQSLNGKILLPDIDLHAYTQDGKHVGVNYTTGVYENEIPGANASRDMLGEEWIFVPDNIKVRFVVDSRDNRIFLNSYPELQQTINGTQLYNLSIVYDVTEDIRYSASVEQSVQPGDARTYRYSIAKNADGTYNIVLDDTAPAIFNASPKNVTNNSQISAQFEDNAGGSGIDNSSISIFIDGIDSTPNATITSSSITIRPLLNDGLHEVILAVSDNAGNKATAGWNFTLDTIPPLIQLYLANGTEFYSDQNLTIDYNVTDVTSGIASSSVELDDIFITTGDMIDLRNLPVGSHTIRVIATDNAGNIAESSTTFIVKPLQAIVKIEPHALNINSNGKWIEAEIEILGYNVSLVDLLSIRLNGTIPAQTKPEEIGEDEKDDENHVSVGDDSEMEIKFNRTQVQNIVSPGSVTLYISGKVNGAAFMGNDTIRVIEKQKKDDEKNEEYDNDDKSKSKGGKSQ